MRRPFSFVSGKKARKAKVDVERHKWIERFMKEKKLTKKQAIVAFKKFREKAFVNLKAVVEEQMHNLVQNRKKIREKTGYSSKLVRQAYQNKGPYSAFINQVLRSGWHGNIIPSRLAIMLLRNLTTKHFFYGEAKIKTINPALLPHRARAFAPFSMKPGPQTQATKIVRDFVRKFPGKNPKTAVDIVHAIAEFKAIDNDKGHLSIMQVYKVYGKRNAEQIIASGSFPTCKRDFGCNDMCTALVATLKAKGIPCKFVRTRANWGKGTNAHSVVMLKVGGKTIVADPFASRPKRIWLVDAKIREKIKELRKAGKWFEGREAWEMGIYTFPADFNLNRWKHKLGLK